MVGVGSEDFQVGDEVDDSGEFFEGSAVAVRQDSPGFQLRDAVFDVDTDSGDGGVEVFVVVGAGLMGKLFDRGDGGGGDVGGVGDPGGCGGVEEVLPATQLEGLRVVSGPWDRVGDGDEVTAVGGGNLDVEALELAFPGVVAAGLPAGWAVPGGNVGAVDEDEMALLDRLGESAWEEDQDRFEEGGDTSPDPGDRGLGYSQEVSHHHLGQVLAKDQQTGHHLAPQGDTAAGQIHPASLHHIGDTASDLVNCFLTKACCRLVTHRLLS